MNPIDLEKFNDIKSSWTWNSIGQPIVWNSDVIFMGNKIWEGDIDANRLNVLKSFSMNYPNYSMTILDEFGEPKMVIKYGIVKNVSIKLNKELSKELGDENE